MADNDTRVNASTANGDAERQLMVYRFTIILFTSLALATLTLIYGATSWWVIKKFRNYQNFVFFNIILSNFLFVLIGVISYFVFSNRLISQYVALQQFTIVNYFLFLYIGTVKIFWFIVMCHMFCVDIVKVFSGRIHRRYFKSVLFAWGLPFIISVFYMYTTSATFRLNSNAGQLFVYSFVLPLILISLLYIITVCTLLSSSKTTSQIATSKWRRLYIATLIFILTYTLMFYSDVFKTFVPPTMQIFELFKLIIDPLLTYIYFVAVKRNRLLCYEFYVNKLNENRNNRDIKIDVINNSPKTDVKTAIIIQSVN